MVNIVYYLFSELQEIAIRTISYDVYNTVTIVLLFGKVSDIASDYTKGGRGVGMTPKGNSA